MSSDLSETSTAAWSARLRRGSTAAFAFTSRSLQQISTFVITLLAARFLLPAEYGVYAIAVVFITLIQTLTYTGLYHFIVTSRDDDHDVLSTSFWMITGLATAASAFLILLAWPLAAAFDAPDLGPVIVLMALIQPVAGASAWFSAALLRGQEVELHFKVMFAQNAIALVGGAAMLGVWQSLFALVFFRYLRVLSAVSLYLGLTAIRPGTTFNKALAKRAMSFSGGLYGSRFLNFLSRYAGDLLLGLMFSTAEAGLYRFGSRFAGGAVDMVGQPMRSFALTQFGAAARKEEALGEPLERFVGSLIMLTGGVAAIVVVFAPAVIEAFFNPAYLAALAVAYAVAVRTVIGAGQAMLEPALAARGKTGRLMIYNAGWTVINIAVVFAAAPFGLAALAWSQAIITALASLAAFRLMHLLGIPTASGLRALGVSLAIVCGYGIALYSIWQVVAGAIASPTLAIASGLALAAIMGALTLVIGWKARVFSLGVFSG